MPRPGRACPLSIHCVLSAQGNPPQPQPFMVLVHPPQMRGLPRHIRTHVHTCKPTNPQTHTYTHTRTQACMHARTHAQRTHARTHACMRAQENAHTHTRMHARAHCTRPGAGRTHHEVPLPQALVHQQLPQLRNLAGSVARPLGQLLQAEGLLAGGWEAAVVVAVAALAAHLRRQGSAGRGEAVRVGTRAPLDAPRAPYGRMHLASTAAHASQFPVASAPRAGARPLWAPTNRFCFQLLVRTILGGATIQA